MKPTAGRKLLRDGFFVSFYDCAVLVQLDCILDSYIIAAIVTFLVLTLMCLTADGRTRKRSRSAAASIVVHTKASMPQVCVSFGHHTTF